MKRYRAILLTICLVLGSLALPQQARAEDAQGSEEALGAESAAGSESDSGTEAPEDGEEAGFTWKLAAEAGSVLDSDGDAVPAVTLRISDYSEKPDYIEIFRALSGEKEFELIGIFPCVEQEDVYAFCDSAVVPGVAYDYSAAAGWYATEEAEGYVSERTAAVSCKVELRKPLIEVQNSAKSIKVLLPASNFVQKYSYALSEGSGIYATGFQIYRSRKENSGYKLIAEVPADATSYKDATVAKGKLYFYKVRTYYYDKATGATYTGDFCERRMGCTGAKNFPNADALGLTATVKSGSAKITWDNADGFVPDTLSYKCRREGESAFGGPQAAELTKKAKSYTIKDIEEGCEYEVRLLVRLKTPYNDGSDHFYYDSRWYVVRFTT